MSLHFSVFHFHFSTLLRISLHLTFYILGQFDGAYRRPMDAIFWFAYVWTTLNLYFLRETSLPFLLCMKREEKFWWTDILDYCKSIVLLVIEHFANQVNHAMLWKGCNMMQSNKPTSNSKKDIAAVQCSYVEILQIPSWG